MQARFTGQGGFTFTAEHKARAHCVCNETPHHKQSSGLQNALVIFTLTRRYT